MGGRFLVEVDVKVLLVREFAFVDEIVDQVFELEFLVGVEFFVGETGIGVSGEAVEFEKVVEFVMGEELVSFGSLGLECRELVVESDDLFENGFLDEEYVERGRVFVVLGDVMDHLPGVVEVAVEEVGVDDWRE